MAAAAPWFRDLWISLANWVPRRRAWPVGIALAQAAAALAYCLPAAAQVNGVGDHPYLGWSSFSQQTLNGNFPDTGQHDGAVRGARGLGVATDTASTTSTSTPAGWAASTPTGGRFPIRRPFPTLPRLPHTCMPMGRNWESTGCPVWYSRPWMPTCRSWARLTTSRTSWSCPMCRAMHSARARVCPIIAKIDFTTPGAQAYIDSVVALFASWGVDLIKLDGVTPGSYNDDLSIDNRGDVQAWSLAIAHSGRPFWLTISWSLDEDYLSTWQQFGNGRRRSMKTSSARPRMRHPDRLAEDRRALLRGNVVGWGIHCGPGHGLEMIWIHWTWEPVWTPG